MDDKLFSPLRLTDEISLDHRVVLAPMTRYRCVDRKPSSMVAQYYSQRASKRALLISEATFVTGECGSHPDAPSMIPETLDGWKHVVSSVHAKKGYIFVQLTHLGRIGMGRFMHQKLPLSSSPIGLSSLPKHLDESGLIHEHLVPKGMDHNDLFLTKEAFVSAAKMAILDAKADGVEILAGIGHLLEQFLADNVNKRRDEYGGSPKARLKYPLEVIKAVCEVVGPSKVGVKITPFSKLFEINDSKPLEHWKYFVGELDKLGLAYIHMVEAGYHIRIYEDVSKVTTYPGNQGNYSLEPIVEVIRNTPVISAGGWSDDNFYDVVEDESYYSGKVAALAFGRWFISNPDLPRRLQLGLPLAPYNEKTVWKHGSEDGYISYHSVA
ncbi:NADPH dehydrogenase 3 [Trichomonascus vanleenenianus]|uniref:NADPH dehydrogenase 3 n=1 Tax=Trichomonascus vanleenenianus TaxID=2268995 RepID=UPI003ECAA487